MEGPVCRSCGRALEPDEIAIYRRMVNRGAESFLCKTCLAAYFQVDEALVEEKIRHFKAAGCTLFTTE